VVPPWSSRRLTSHSYSGGRDGVICAWDLKFDPEAELSQPKSAKSTKFRASTQAHTHWINDIVLASDNNALVSASSDLTVKVWRPLAGQAGAQTIGQHVDYVKCVATSKDANWAASGGLDRKIYLWDLNGAGKSLEIDVSGEEITEKGSVYALSASRSIIASGGPESVVRLWDPKTGKRITKFAGHTDNVRSILVNEAGDTVMTASSDQTVKVWSVTAGRCMYTLTMHNDSVWSLFSTHPQLRVFYSSDRSGLVVKTDVRGTADMDEGLSVAVAQEHEGVSKIVASREYIWTASASSSINRWNNVETGPDAVLPEAFRLARGDSHSPRQQPSHTAAVQTNGVGLKEIPIKSILRISNTAPFPPQITSPSEATLIDSEMSKVESDTIVDVHTAVIEPIYQLPEETIEGQHGLVKHRLLNDRRRVLTLDTAGDVLLWDLVKVSLAGAGVSRGCTGLQAHMMQCEVIQRFGKRHLEDVEPEVNTLEAVAPWCSIDTSSGDLTVVLEQFNCFDAEMYADELAVEEPVEFREDQRSMISSVVLCPAR
jgi:WD repeat-containing protein 48